MRCLIQILSKHGALPSDVVYLRWFKEKRDYFIQRFFHDHNWPGDLGDNDADHIIRRLRYLEMIFIRASARMGKILANADLLERVDLGADGSLLINHRFFDEGSSGGL